jgi:parallel beta-helix repeat protein
VVIDEKRIKITIDGRGTATVNGIDEKKHTIDLRGRGIVIKGLHITGGYNGISVNRGGTATINGNIIELASHHGIHVNASFACVVNNTIRDNSNNGIEVHDNATAFIGFVYYSDKIAQPNTIQGNGKQGINIQRSSSASVLGNLIQNNIDNGIMVHKDSHADIANNTINSNGADGIRVETNSGVNLGNDADTNIFALFNVTDAPNGNNGIGCDIGGYADGLLGTLNGVNGPTSFSNGCFDSLL